MSDNMKFIPISELKHKLKNKKVIFKKDNFWEVFSKCNSNCGCDGNCGENCKCKDK